jgi:hypothetical protein
MVFLPRHAHDGRDADAERGDCDLRGEIDIVRLCSMSMKSQSKLQVLAITAMSTVRAWRRPMPIAILPAASCCRCGWDRRPLESPGRRHAFSAIAFGSSQLSPSRGKA